MTSTFTLPLRVVSEANRRDHWAAKAKRVKRQRSTVCVYWRSRDMPEGRKPTTVRLTRIAPRTLDSDNLAGAFKAVRDEIAFLCGFDDRDESVTWTYAQAKGPYSAGVEVTW